jgi:hypothetical protein
LPIISDGMYEMPLPNMAICLGFRLPKKAGPPRGFLWKAVVSILPPGCAAQLQAGARI